LFEQFTWFYLLADISPLMVALTSKLKILGCMMILIGFFTPTMMPSGAASHSEDKPMAVPDAKWMTELVYDPNIGMALMFGGAVEGSYFSDETWRYDYSTNGWLNMNPTSHPPAMSKYAMVYDLFEHRMILFGGYIDGSPPDAINQTWAYDWQTNNWTQRFPTNHPIGLSDPAMVYDSAQQKTILFGGYDQHSNYDETWAYDWDTNNWTQRYPENHPYERDLHEMIYDPINAKTILYGGWADEFSNQTWAYDWNTNNWTQLYPEHHPSGRQEFGMVYDTVESMVLLFGGNCGDEQNDTWEYDYTTNNWTQLFPVVAPSGRTSMGMTWDSYHYKIILYGGNTNIGSPDPNNETWFYDYDDNNWTQLGLQPSITVTFYIDPNHGYITFNGTRYDDGESGIFYATQYTISVHVNSGYEFSSWEIVGDCTIEGGYANVEDDCSITANLQVIDEDEDDNHNGGGGTGGIPESVSVAGTEIPTIYFVVLGFAGVVALAYAFTRRK
jgi:hypothetical protein